MKTIMMLADYANVTADGKLNVLGIFSQIHAAQFPARHHAMFVVAQISLEIGEKPITRPFAIRLLSEDAEILIEATGEIGFRQTEKGELPSVNIIVAINGAIFPIPGTYEFILLVNEETKASIPIQVYQREQPLRN